MNNDNPKLYNNVLSGQMLLLNIFLLILTIGHMITLHKIYSLFGKKLQIPCQMLLHFALSCADKIGSEDLLDEI